MRITVKLFANLAQHYQPTRRPGERIALELPEGSTVREVLAYLGLPEGEVKVIFVNGRAVGRDRVLMAGDELGVFPPIGGG